MSTDMLQKVQDNFSVAVGVAMGFAIHLINAAAFNEFSAAIGSLAGQADVQVSGREASIDETVYPRLARHAGVALASPVLEIDGRTHRLGARTVVGRGSEADITVDDGGISRKHLEIVWDGRRAEARDLGSTAERVHGRSTILRLTILGRAACR